jgi:hypothetical protein
MENNRLIRLKSLRTFLNIGHEDMNLAKSLSIYFIGEAMGCGCKYQKVRSQLNQLWERELKKELEEYESKLD